MELQTLVEVGPKSSQLCFVNAQLLTAHATIGLASLSFELSKIHVTMHRLDGMGARTTTYYNDSGRE
jgi:hypothetical protein